MTPSPSKRRSKCTNSADLFQVLCVLHDVLRVLCVLHAHPFPVVFYGIAVIFGPSKANVTKGNKYDSCQTNSDDAVAVNIQMTGARY